MVLSNRSKDFTPNQKEDRFSSSQDFTVFTAKTATSFINNSMDKLKQTLTKQIWKVKPPKKVLVWTLAYRRIDTQNKLQRKNLHHPLLPKCAIIASAAKSRKITS